jgi:hypothetical protein
MPPQTENLKLQFEILAKRKGDTNFTRLKDDAVIASEVDDYLVVARPLSGAICIFFKSIPPGKLNGFSRKTIHPDFPLAQIRLPQEALSKSLPWKMIVFST